MLHVITHNVMILFHFAKASCGANPTPFLPSGDRTTMVLPTDELDYDNDLRCPLN